MSLLIGLAGAVVIGYLPGALVYRLPVLSRQRRAALAGEERAFWHVIISLAWSLAFVLGTAAAGVYRYDYLIVGNLVISAAALAAGRDRLVYRGSAAKVTIAALVPLVILSLGIWRFYPGSEYIVGGKDPGVYINEGIAIDRTGALFRHDAVVAAVPAADRDLFFPSHGVDEYYGTRFMGVYLNDPATGAVVAQFPHLLSASVAIAYHLAGTMGAVRISGLWGVLGLLAVYFFGARLIGRLASFFAVVLLALNVVEVWYGRYPNAEVLMQTLLFGGLLALARTQQDDDPFFGWVAGLLMGLLIFLRFDAFLAIAASAAGLALAWIVGRRLPRRAFIVLVAGATVLGLAYYIGPMRAYFALYKWNLPSLPVGLGAAALGLLIVFMLGRVRAGVGDLIVRILPLALGIVLVLLAVYALFLREPAGKLTEWDAYSLRTYREAYVYWPALVTAIAGCIMVTRREFWRDPPFFLVFAAFALFFFYKIRVVPEQLWMARRFIPMVMPGMLLLASGAVFGPSSPEFRRTVRRGVAASAFLSFIGWQYAVAARPVAAHVEYRGVVKQIDQLARRFTPRDLILIENRNSGTDLHVLGVPLADIYGLQVLGVNDVVEPDRRRFEAFLANAARQYDRVFMLASGGSDLLSRHITATPVAFVPLTVPEYETTPWDRFPKGPRTKDLGYSIYQLTPVDQRARPFVVDVGYLDDLQVVRFFAREVSEGRTFRWTGAQSYVAVTGLSGQEHEVEFVMHDGGRPAGAPPAIVDVFFNDIPLGTIRVGFGFASYRLAIPAEAVRAAAAGDDPAQLRLVSSVWSPSDFGGGDTRALGVMVDKVEIH